MVSYRAASSAQPFSKCFAPGGGEQLGNVVPEFPHVGNFAPEVFQLPPPLVHDPPHEIFTAKFELEFKKASKTLFISSPSNVMS